MAHSFRDAGRGVWRCICAERNMRVHVVACAYVVFFGYRVGLSRGEWACLLLAMGAVTGAEALNTAVERLCDFVEPRPDSRIGAVKDMAAGGGGFCAFFAGIAGLAVFLRPALRQVVQEIFSAPLPGTAFVGSLLLAVLFVLYGPGGGRKG